MLRIMEQKTAYKVLIMSITVNVLLSILKFAAGIAGNSSAMISDAADSASDVFSTIVVIIGIKASVKEADAEHPYGHERMESVAAVIISAVLLLTGLSIGFDGIKHIVEGNYVNDDAPSFIALIAAVVSIIIKEFMFRYTKSVAKKIHSDSILADAWHHRSDALSSVGSFSGILGSMLGFKIADSLASIIICVLILKAGIDIATDAINKMVDKSCDIDTEQKIKGIIQNEAGVVRLDDIKTRMFGSRIYVDIIIETDGDIPLRDAHEIAERVHDKVEVCCPQVKHCMIHVNPAEQDDMSGDSIP